MKRQEITVLIVEDHQPEINAIKTALMKQGILPENIKNTADVREALAIIKIQEPHMVFVDFHLTTIEEGYGEGSLLLADITKEYENNPYYTPFTIAISANMTEQAKNMIISFSSARFSKHQKDYPDLALNKFLMSLGVTPKKPIFSSDHTRYMKKATHLVKIELEPFGFFTLSESYQQQVIQFIFEIIPTIDKRFVNLELAYQKVAEKLNIESPNTVKTTINRAFNKTFKKIDNFLELYTGNDSKDNLGPKNFYQHIATLVKAQL